MMKCESFEVKAADNGYILCVYPKMEKEKEDEDGNMASMYHEPEKYVYETQDTLMREIKKLFSVSSAKEYMDKSSKETDDE